MISLKKIDELAGKVNGSSPFLRSWTRRPVIRNHGLHAIIADLAWVALEAAVQAGPTV